MAIALGELVFDPDHTTVREGEEEVAGRDARTITITGVIAGESTVAAIEARLDAILRAASEDETRVPLSLRDGRVLYVRRESFEREVSRAGLVGSFTLKLAADDPFEVAVVPTEITWAVDEPESTLAVTPSGNTDSPAVFRITVHDTLVSPGVSDGERTIIYDGILAAGDVLVLDGENGSALLNGEDVTPYLDGVFPRLSPLGTVLTYSDGPGSSHIASIAVSFRDRWW